MTAPKRMLGAGFICLFACLCAKGQATNLYHTNRVFKAITLTNLPLVSAYEVLTAAGRLTQVVGPTNVIIDTTNTYATEYEGFAWGYESAVAAWTSAASVHWSYSLLHSNEFYDNAGWVKGTKESYGTWGAFLWRLENTIAFKTSTTNRWISPYSTTNPIVQVLVGSLGDYAAVSNVVDVGPTNWALMTNFLGAGVSTDKIYRANLDTYYEVLIPDLLSTRTTNTLLGTNIFRARSYPTRLMPTNYHFEIRRASSGTWYTLTNGPASAYTSLCSVAGTFKLRVTVTVSNLTAMSRERDWTVRFPSYTEITSDPNVRSALDAAWASTLAATTPTTRREEGFWISVDATARGYDFAATDYGDPVGPAQGGVTHPRPKPSDSPASPTPLETPIYTVAYFHTHTPTTYRTRPRELVGPSRPPQPDNDESFCDYYQTVGIVYDYVATLGLGIPAHYPLDGPARLYHAGRVRRATPP